MKLALRLGGIGMMAAGAVLAVVFWFSGPHAPTGKLDRELYVKKKVITGAYKTYAAKHLPVPMWLAKTVFHNSTNQRIKDLRVRYRVPEYSDWSSWHDYPAVDPGQTVVDLYNPILSSGCAKLTSRSPAELRMQYEYLDQMGRIHKSYDSRQITMLDPHEFIFSDLSADEMTDSAQDAMTYAYLLAAWVSQDDAPIARLASMADKKAGGLGAVTSDQDCIKVMRALYDIMRTIHISYQSPQAMNDPGLSYDIKTVQSIQYPQDTVEKRSGTCIDLAILYAAMMNSVDIRPYLVVTDDHCFPVARTPSGNFVPVEATGVGDGYNKAFTFEQAVKSGARTWQKVNQTGRFVLVDVRKMWMSGVANPELASLPPDILDRWGITALVNGPAAPAAQVAARGPNQEQPAAAQPDTRQPDTRQPAPAPAPAVVAGIDGRWIYTVPVGGRLTSGRFEIRGGNSRLMLIGSASYQAMGPDGRYHYFREVDHCVGSLRGRSVSAECDNVSLTMDGRPLQPPGLPLYLSLMLAPGGKSMQGQVRNTLGMVEPVAMRR